MGAIVIMVKPEYIIELYKRAWLTIKVMDGWDNPRMFWTRDCLEAAAFSNEEMAMDFIVKQHLSHAKVRPRETAISSRNS